MGSQSRKRVDHRTHRQNHRKPEEVYVATGRSNKGEGFGICYAGECRFWLRGDVGWQRVLILITSGSLAKEERKYTCVLFTIWRFEPEIELRRPAGFKAQSLWESLEGLRRYRLRFISETFTQPVALSPAVSLCYLCYYWICNKTSSLTHWVDRSSSSTYVSFLGKTVHEHARSCVPKGENINERLWSNMNRAC